MAHSRMSPERVRALEREASALKLRGRGQDYGEIGKALGVNPATAWRLVQRAYQRSLRLNDGEAEFQRQLDLTRCDAAINALWPQVLKGHVRSIEALMRVLERRSSLLGLDAPVKIDIEHRIRQIAEETGLDPEEAVREARKILAAAR